MESAVCMLFLWLLFIFFLFFRGLFMCLIRLHRPFFVFGGDDGTISIAKYTARTMDQILLMRRCIADDGIKKFFLNILLRECRKGDLLGVLIARERPPRAVEILVRRDADDARRLRPRGRCIRRAAAYASGA